MKKNGLPTQDEIAAYLDLSARRVRALQAMGIMNNRMTLQESLHAYIRYLRACISGNRQGEGDLTALHDLHID